MDDGVDAWLGELRTDQAVRDRSRAAALRRQASEECHLAGVLGELAERGRPVVIDLGNGRRHRARIDLVGSDVVGIVSATGTRSLVPIAAVTAVRPLPGDSPVAAADPQPRPATLAQVLGSLVGSGVRVTVWPITGDPLHGTVIATGPDVIGLDVDGGGGIAYVASTSLAEVSVAESG